MEYRYEIINFQQSVKMKCFLHKLGFVPRHWHESLEILFVVSGKINVLVDNRAYVLHEEDVLLINSKDTHALSSSEGVVIALQIDLSMFADEMPDISDLQFHCNSFTSNNPESFDYIRSMIVQMIDNSNSQTPYHAFLNKSMSYKLIYHLLLKYKVNQDDVELKKSTKHYNRITRILGIINEKYAEKITLADLASEMYLSAPYLSKFFQDYIGTHFTAYLNSVRFNHAVSDLLKTDLSIEEIAVKNGFPNSHAFVKLFKKQYSTLPSKYRRSNKTRSSNINISTPFSKVNYLYLEKSTYLNKLEKYLTHSETDNTLPSSTSKTSVEANSMNTVSKLQHNFLSFTSVGRASDILISDVQAMLKDLQSDIGFKYIKFHGLLDDDMCVYSEDQYGKPIFSFVLIDKTIDFLLSINLIPLIQLSFMPRKLAKTPSASVFDAHFINSLPKKMDYWTELVRALTSHLISRYGIDEIRNWFFTVWNEPDTSSDFFGLPSDDFFPFYKETYLAVKDVCKDITFASPSVLSLAMLHTEWLDQFCLYCKQNNCLPDIFLIHFYDCDTNLAQGNINPAFQESLTLSKDPNSFSKFIKFVKSHFEYLELSDRKIYLTEWNSTSSHRDLLNDTVFKSCYLVKNIIENFDAFESCCYWMLTDLNKEFLPSANTFHGGLGLFTSTGLKKPQYHALKLLSKLKRNCISKGHGYIITKDENSFSMLLYNYKHYSDLYASGEMFNTSETNRYACFGVETSHDFNIVLKNIPEGKYVVREHIINRQHGSVFDKWLEMGAIELSKTTDIKRLQDLSNPMLIISELSSYNGNIHFNCTLAQLEVRLITLELTK